MGEKSMLPGENILSITLGCNGPVRDASEIAVQNSFILARGALSAGLGDAASDDRSVHGPGAGADNALDLKQIKAEDAIENAPGEGAMRAAALQSQMDMRFALLASCGHELIPLNSRGSRGRMATSGRR